MNEITSSCKFLSWPSVITAVLGIERQLATRLGLENVATHANIEQLSQDTPIDEITRKLQEHLPES